MNTGQQFDQIAQTCIELFSKKAIDYGTAWRILRTSSLTDQIYIKAQRIRSIEEKGVAKIDEGIIPEFIGIVNYSVMALIQLEIGVANSIEEQFDVNQAIELFKKHIQNAKNLMIK